MSEREYNFDALRDGDPASDPPEYDLDACPTCGGYQAFILADIGHSTAVICPVCVKAHEPTPEFYFRLLALMEEESVKVAAEREAAKQGSGPENPLAAPKGISLGFLGGLCIWLAVIFGITWAVS